MKLANITNYFAKFLELQFFITITSLPILIFWGLPISLMSPLGNLVFTPILAIFLLFSAIIFFTELLGIPNSLFIWILERIADIWLCVINLGKSSWLINFRVQYLLILLIPTTICAAMIIKSKFSIYRRLFFLFLLISLIFLVFSFSADSKKHVVYNSQGKLECYFHNGAITLIDKGALSISSTNSWIDFNLLTELSKKYGTRNIKKLVLTRINLTQMKAIKHLREFTNLETVDISRVKKDHFYKDFKEFSIKNGIEIIDNH